jgi:hypothetical protein
MLQLLAFEAPSVSLLVTAEQQAEGKRQLPTNMFGKQSVSLLMRLGLHVCVCFALGNSTG